MKPVSIFWLGLMGKMVCIGQIVRAHLEEPDIRLQEAAWRQRIHGSAAANLHGDVLAGVSPGRP